MFRRLLAAGALLVTTSVAAQEPLKIVAYPLERVALYDAQGEFLEDMPREALPKPEVPVIHFDEARDLIQIALPDRQVWLDPMDVKLNQSKSAEINCREVAETSVKADNKVKAVMGYSEECGK